MGGNHDQNTWEYDLTIVDKELTFSQQRSANSTQPNSDGAKRQRLTENSDMPVAEKSE